MKSTYILFGSTNPYLAKFGPFRGRTRIAVSAEYTTQAGAIEKLMAYCAEESDNYNYNEHGTRVQSLISYDERTNTAQWNTIMEQGDMQYEHDGRTWEFIRLDELTESDARIAMRDRVLSQAEEGEIYAMYPELRPANDDNE